MNAITVELLSELGEILDELGSDLPGAVVLAGGEKAFSAGADIGGLAGPEVGASMSAAFHGTLDALARLRRVTIAAVRGVALGGGCELALACDLRMGGESCRLGLPEILLGIIPGGGGTQRLARLVGPSRAKDLILSGRQVRVPEALAMGLLDRVVPDEEVLAQATDWAASFARGPLVAQAMAKEAIDVGLEEGLLDGLALERRLFEQVLATEDATIGIESFLRSGAGKARFVGR